MSPTLRWRAGEELAKLGTVNSADLRKPKKAKLHAAQNMHWSNVDESKDRKMIIKTRGSGKPSSICREQTAER